MPLSPSRDELRRRHPWPAQEPRVPEDWHGWLPTPKGVETDRVALGGCPPGAPTDPSLKEPLMSSASWRSSGRGIFSTPDCSGVFQQESPITRYTSVARRNGVRLCGDATERGISGPRVGQWCIGPLVTEGRWGPFCFPHHWTPEPCLENPAAQPRLEYSRPPIFSYFTESLHCRCLSVRSDHGLFSPGFLQPIFSSPCGCAPIHPFVNTPARKQSLRPSGPNTEDAFRPSRKRKGASFKRTPGSGAESTGLFRLASRREDLPAQWAGDRCNYSLLSIQALRGS